MHLLKMLGMWEWSPLTCYHLCLTTQNAIGRLCYKGTLLAHVQPSVNQDPGSFSSKLISSYLAPIQHCCRGYSDLGLVVCVCPCRTSQGSCEAISITCPAPSEYQSYSSSILNALASSVSAENWLRVHSVPPSRSVIKPLNSPSIDPWGILLAISPGHSSSREAVQMHDWIYPYQLKKFCIWWSLGVWNIL